MGRIAKGLSFVRTTRPNGAKVTDVKADKGGKDNVTGVHYSAPGDDSFPCDADYALFVEREGTGREDVAGWLDPVNTPKAEKGDKRIYARDASGVTICEIWLKSSGDVEVLSTGGSIKADNGSGSFELKASGDIDLNGVTIDTSGNMVVPTSLSLAGKELATHDHPIAGGSSAPGPTGPNN